MAKTKVAIIGRGNAGSALARGLTDSGYEVKTVGKEPDRVGEVGQWADTIILAVPYGERRNAMEELGDRVRDKTLVDVSNALGPDGSFQGSARRSGAEELRDMAKHAKVVKAFNTVFAQNMATGQTNGQQLSLFVAADDDEAKATVLNMGQALGFDAIDAGPLENARWLEAMGYLNIALGYKLNLGPESGFHYVHARSAGRPDRPRSEAKRHATSKGVVAG